MANKNESMRADEALSALVDGELDALSRDRILGRLLEDPELRARWARYHAGRATLEGAEPVLVGVDFSERVCAAVSAERPITAPGRLRGSRRPFPGRAAIATAVAAVMGIVAVGVAVVLRDGTPGSSVPVIAGDESGTTIAAGDDSPPLVSGTFGEGLAPDDQDRVRQRLAMYMNNHNRFADAGELPNVMPSSRLVGFNAEP